MRIDAVLARLPGVQVVELAQWVERGWVRPEAGEGGALEFHEIDVARCRLIVDLRQDLGVSEDAVPVVLGLLDQVYELRGRLRAMTHALAGQPEQVRQAMLAMLQRAGRND